MILLKSFCYVCPARNQLTAKLLTLTLPISFPEFLLHLSRETKMQSFPFRWKRVRLALGTRMLHFRKVESPPFILTFWVAVCRARVVPQRSQCTNSWPTGVQEVMGSGTRVFHCPTLVTTEYSIFLILGILKDFSNCIVLLVALISF